MTQRRRFITKADDLMSYRCFSKNCDALFFPHIFSPQSVTYNTLLLEADVDFITDVCGFFHNVDTMSYALGYQDIFAWHTHLSSTIQHTTVTQHRSETLESNISLRDEQKVKEREGSQGGTLMHNLSKSHPNPYLFTDLFNKEKKNTCKHMNLPVVVTVY